MSNEGLLSVDQQADLRGLCESVAVGLKELYPQTCAQSEVLVTDQGAAVLLTSGLRPLTAEEHKVLAEAESKGDIVTASRLKNIFSAARGTLTRDAKTFLQELSMTGSPLFGSVDQPEGAVAVNFKLSPNDVIGAELKLAALFKRLKKNASQN